MRFPEYTTACRAPVRTCTELYGSATSVWVKVPPQSELMGPISAGFVRREVTRVADRLAALTMHAEDAPNSHARSNVQVPALNVNFVFVSPLIVVHV